ncbi:MAG: alpha-L-fucosidase [Bacillota bacterium]|nr:alpha-L-fucosidase [Bacillota bacterium]
MNMPIDQYNKDRDAASMNAGSHEAGGLRARLQKKICQYEVPDDPLIRERLEWFSDQKLGLMIHFGLYSQLGIKESHPLLDLSVWKGDPNWMRWQLPEHQNIREFKTDYVNLNKSFNPVRFDPDQWADIACDAGFKYLLMTAKHHDGFCLWDTKTTDYRVTGPDCPYRYHRNADIVGSIYDAFRARGMAISVYFSKSDWMSPYYWEPGYLLNGQTSSGPSYDPAKRPELWDKFKAYTHEQIRELTTRYGRVDCLWFDGGIKGLEIDKMVVEARKTQPWLLSADRSQGGQYENFITPELEIPDWVLPVPWETCLCLGKKMEGERYISFGYTYDQEYYSAAEVVHIFLEIACRGGNLALNIGPQPDGRFPARAMKSLQDLGRWMSLFGRGIYGARPYAPFFADFFRYMKKDGKIFVFRLYQEEEAIPAQLQFALPDKVRSVSYMRTSQTLDFIHSESYVQIGLPTGMIGCKGMIADGFELTIT